MTRIQIELPDATAQAAREAGLLTAAAIERLIQEALHRRPSATSQPLRKRLAALAREVDAVPATADRRTDEAILGYDEHGSW